MFVTKRDGRSQAWNNEKIERAVRLACDAAGEDYVDISRQVYDALAAVQDPPADGSHVPVDEVHNEVERQLMQRCPAAAKAYILFREERNKSRSFEPLTDEIQNYVFAAKYSRDGETYDQAIDRVIQMHEMKFPLFDMSSLKKDLKEKKILPSMRSLQFAGKSIEDHNPRLFNCSFTLCDRARVWGDALYLLLCGCGVGYSVQKRHIQWIPEVHLQNRIVVHHRIEDSIQGWAQALRTLCYHAFFTGNQVEFSYEDIRPEGAPLKTSGGFAPGHLPLKETLENFRRIFKERQGHKLSSLECHDLFCYAAEAVLAGGIRRSSLICVFDQGDTEMRTCKSSQVFQRGGLNKQRELANNSEFVMKGTLTISQIQGIISTALTDWDPGVYLGVDYDCGPNPCAEINMDPVLRISVLEADTVLHLFLENSAWPDQKLKFAQTRTFTGFSFCNLTEINGKTIVSEDDFYRRARAASYLGTIQASWTNFKHLEPISEIIAKRDALLGVSITGMADNPDFCFNEEMLRAAADQVYTANAKLSETIGIRRGKRLTCIKPSGTASLVLNCSSGIHPHHAKRYFRRIKATKYEPAAKAFQEANPHAVEFTPDGHLSLIFPIQTSGITLDDTTAISFLKQIKRVYENWVLPCSPDRLTHNVSCTVAMHDHELEEVCRWIVENQKCLASLSFTGRFAEKGIKFLPRQKVDGPEDEVKWRNLISKWKPVNYDGISAQSYDPECAGGQCAF